MLTSQPHQLYLFT